MSPLCGIDRVCIVDKNVLSRNVSFSAEIYLRLLSGGNQKIRSFAALQIKLFLIGQKV
jgi:hypothetical protein